MGMNITTQDRRVHDPEGVPRPAGQEEVGPARPEVPREGVLAALVPPAGRPVLRDGAQGPDAEPLAAARVRRERAGVHAHEAEADREHDVLAVAQGERALLEVQGLVLRQRRSSRQGGVQPVEGGGRQADARTAVVVDQPRARHVVELAHAEVVGVRRVQPQARDQQAEVLGQEVGVALQAAVPVGTPAVVLGGPEEHVQQLHDRVGGRLRRGGPHLAVELGAVRGHFIRVDGVEVDDLRPVQLPPSWLTLGRDEELEVVAVRAIGPHDRLHVGPLRRPDEGHEAADRGDVRAVRRPRDLRLGLGEGDGPRDHPGVRVWGRGRGFARRSEPTRRQETHKAHHVAPQSKLYTTILI